MITKDLRFARNASLYSSYDGVIHALNTSIVQKIGQPLIHLFIENNQTGAIKCVMTIGKKDGIGKECYEIINNETTDQLLENDLWVNENIGLLSKGTYLPKNTKLSDVVSLMIGSKSGTRKIKTPKKLDTYEFGSRTMPILCELGIKTDTTTNLTGYFVKHVVLMHISNGYSNHLANLLGNAVIYEQNNLSYPTKYTIKSDNVIIRQIAKNYPQIDFIVLTFPDTHPLSTIIDTRNLDSIESFVSRWTYDLTSGEKESHNKADDIDTGIVETLNDRSRYNKMKISLFGVPIIVPGYISSGGQDYVQSFLNSSDAPSQMLNALVSKNEFRFTINLNHRVVIDNKTLIPFPYIISNTIQNSICTVDYSMNGIKFEPVLTQTVQYSQIHKDGLYHRNSSSNFVPLVVYNNYLSRMNAISATPATLKLDFCLNYKIDEMVNPETGEYANVLKYRQEVAP